MSHDYYDRLALIDRVCATVNDATESWEPDTIGSQLAYLVWDIAAPHAGVDWTTQSTRPILDLFTKIFSEKDPVWSFINQPTKRHFIVVGRRPYGQVPTRVAHVVAPDARCAAKQFGAGWLYEGVNLPSDWYDVGVDPLTKLPWMVIEGLVEINDEPKTVFVDHKINDL